MRLKRIAFLSLLFVTGLALLVSCSFGVQPSKSNSNDGDGTNENVNNQIHLAKAEDLLKLKNGGSFVLDNDIDCGGLGFKSLIDVEENITLNGNGHKISNVKILNTKGYAGLIGNSKGNVNVSKLELNAIIDGNDKYQESTIGLLIGQCDGVVKLDECSFYGSVKASTDGCEKSFIGGAIGYSYKLELKNVLTDIDVDCSCVGLKSADLEKAHKLYIGGVVGRTQDLKIDSVINLGSLTITNGGGRKGGYVKAAPICGFADAVSGINLVSVPRKFHLPHPDDYSYTVSPVTNHEGCNLTRGYYASENDGIEDGFDSNANLESKDYNEIYLGRHQILSSEILLRNYTYDNAGNEERIFLKFDGNIWDTTSMSEGANTRVKLKIFAWR